MPSRRRPAPDPAESGLPPRTVLPRPNVADRCPEPGCGLDGPGPISAARGESRMRVPRGWIHITVRDSTEVGRWFCSPPCAARGIALAQLRLTPLLPKPTTSKDPR